MASKRDVRSYLGVVSEKKEVFWKIGPFGILKRRTHLLEILAKFLENTSKVVEF